MNTIKIISSNGNRYCYDIQSGILNSIDTERNYTIHSQKFNNSMFKLSITEEDIIHQLTNSPQIVFEVTERCNLQCKYCIYSECYETHTKRTGKDLSENDAKQVIDYVCNLCEQYNTKSTNITISFYGGEPLLRFNFIKEIIQYVEHKWNNFNICFNMTTNATLLKGEIVDYLAEKNVKLLISLDGNRENNSYRVYKNGNSSFDDIIKNIDDLKNKYPYYFLTKIDFNTVLHNKNSTKEATDFIFSKYQKKTILSELAIDGVKNEYKKEFIDMYKNTLEGIRQEDYSVIFTNDNLRQLPSFRDAIFFIYNETPYIYASFIELFFNRVKLWKPTGTCIPFGRKIFVSSNGNIYPCESVPHRITFGQIINNKLIINFTEIAKKYNQIMSVINKQCTKCYRKYNCGQCVYFLKSSNEYYCEGFMGKEAFIKYITDIVDFFENNQDAYRKIIEEISLS